MLIIWEVYEPLERLSPLNTSEIKGLWKKVFCVSNKMFLEVHFWIACLQKWVLGNTVWFAMLKKVLDNLVHALATMRCLTIWYFWVFWINSSCDKFAWIIRFENRLYHDYQTRTFAYERTCQVNLTFEQYVAILSPNSCLETIKLEYL